MQDLPLNCLLDHHPSPCDWQDKEGAVCTFHLVGSPSLQSNSSNMEGDATLEQQLEQVRQERDGERRRAERWIGWFPFSTK